MHETRKNADAAHTLLNLPAQPISEEVLLEKYAKGGERSIAAVHARVVSHGLITHAPSNGSVST